MNEKLKEEFAVAFEKYGDDLFKFCFYKISDRELAKDLTQRAFEKVWIYVAKGKKIKNLRALLYKTLKCLIIDEYRRKSKTISLEDLQEKGFDKGVDSTSAVDLERKINKNKVEKALRKLKAKYQDVIILRYIEERSVNEVADILNISANSASVRINRALKKLELILKDLE